MVYSMLCFEIMWAVRKRFPNYNIIVNWKLQCLLKNTDVKNNVKAINLELYHKISYPRVDSTYDLITNKFKMQFRINVFHVFSPSLHCFVTVCSKLNGNGGRHYFETLSRSVFKVLNCNWWDLFRWIRSILEVHAWDPAIWWFCDWDW